MKWFISILILVIILSFKKNYQVETKNAISNVDVILNDGDLFPTVIRDKKYNPWGEQEVRDFDVYKHSLFPYFWADSLPIITSNIPKSIPALLRTMDGSDYFNFKEFIDRYSEFYSDPTFMNVKYERIGLGDRYWASNILYSLFNSKICREAFFNYLLQIYSQNNYPQSSRKNHIRIIDNSLVFLNNYPSNRSKYLSLLNNKSKNGVDFKELLGSACNTFLFRRIESNKIPITELKDYLNRIKSKITSLPVEFLSFKNVDINKGDIIISDELVDNNGVDIVVSNKRNTKKLKFRDFQQVKCLKDNSKNYYLIISDFIYKNGYEISYSQTMIDSDLKIINVSKIPINDGLSELVENEKIEKTTNSIVMKKKNGVYYIPVEVNGYSMEFVFDTGASSVSISLTEAMLLYKNGKLSKSDILGSQYFSDANGDISEGTKINIRIIKIGNKILQNVEATVVHNLEAPLLLGQSALNKFGKFYVNTANNTITFE